MLQAIIFQYIRFDVDKKNCLYTVGQKCESISLSVTPKLSVERHSTTFTFLYVNFTAEASFGHSILFAIIYPPKHGLSTQCFMFPGILLCLNPVHYYTYYSSSRSDFTAINKVILTGKYFKTLTNLTNNKLYSSRFVKIHTQISCIFIEVF